MGGVRCKGCLLIVAGLFILGGCRTGKIVTPHQQKKDSTYIKVVTKTDFVTKTVYLEVPTQTAERTTRDSTSHLENDYATSDARINPDGTLYHDLATKPQDKPIPVNIPSERKDSIVYRYRGHTVTDTVEVERELTWWQRTQMYGFWVALAALAIYIIIVNRKGIIGWIMRKLV